MLSICILGIDCVSTAGTCSITRLDRRVGRVVARRRWFPLERADLSRYSHRSGSVHGVRSAHLGDVVKALGLDPVPFARTGRGRVTQLFARASFDGRARESRRPRGTHSRGGHTVEPPGSHPGGQRLAALRVTDRSRLVGWSSPALMSSTFSDAPRRRASTAGPSPWDGRKLEPPVTSLEACRLLLVQPRRPLASLLPEAAREPSGRLQSCPFAPAVARVGCAFELAFVGEARESLAPSSS